MAFSGSAHNQSRMECDPSEPSDARIKKLVERLNLTGQKLHELRAVLLQESLQTGEDVDSLAWLMSSSCFIKQVRLVDAIRISSPHSLDTLSTLTSRKEKYHYYEDLLETFNQSRCQKDLDSLFNDTVRSVTDLANRSSSSADFRNHNQDMEFQTNMEPSNLSMVEPEQAIQENSQTASDSEIQDGSFSLDKLRSGSDTPVNISGESSDILVARLGSITETDLTNDNVKENEFCYVKSPKRDEVALEPYSKSKNCKVMKLKTRNQKPHIQNLFPGTSTSIQSESSSVTSINNRSPLNCAMIGSGSAIESFMSAGSGTPPWAHKSKSVNESWFEFKERCSTSSLPSLMTPSERPVTESGTTFRLSDYMPKTSSTSEMQIAAQKKSVRFSTNPNPTDSSSEEDVSFDVQQFPCVTSMKRRGGGILKK